MVGRRLTACLQRTVADLPVRAPAVLVMAIVAGGMVATTLFSPPAEANLAGIGLAMALAVVAAYALARIDGVPGTLGPALVAIALIGFVREEAGGGASGVTTLFMLPIIWLALYAATWQAVVAAFAAALMMLAPVLLGDPTGYDPTEESRRLFAFAIVTSILIVLSWWLRREMLTDPLTRVGNRRAWDRDLDRELARADRAGERLVVAIIDLDRFKQYNDRHGHLAGDRHLAASASAWRAALRRDDVLVRAGGEEFFLLLPRTSNDEAQVVLDRVRSSTPDGETCSIGFAAWDGTESPGSLLHRADEALYAAKAGGRDRITGAPACDRPAAA